MDNVFKMSSEEIFSVASDSAITEAKAKEIAEKKGTETGSESAEVYKNSVITAFRKGLMLKKGTHKETSAALVKLIEDIIPDLDKINDITKNKSVTLLPDVTFDTKEAEAKFKENITGFKQRCLDVLKDQEEDIQKSVMESIGNTLHLVYKGKMHESAHVKNILTYDEFKFPAKRNIKGTGSKVENERAERAKDPTAKKVKKTKVEEIQQSEASIINASENIKVAVNEINESLSQLGNADISNFVKLTTAVKKLSENNNITFNANAISDSLYKNAAKKNLNAVDENFYQGELDNLFDRGFDVTGKEALDVIEKVYKSIAGVQNLYQILKKIGEAENINLIEVLGLESFESITKKTNDNLLELGKKISDLGNYVDFNKEAIPLKKITDSISEITGEAKIKISKLLDETLIKLEKNRNVINTIQAELIKAKASKDTEKENDLLAQQNDAYTEQINIFKALLSARDQAKSLLDDKELFQITNGRLGEIGSTKNIGDIDVKQVNSIKESREKSVKSYNKKHNITSDIVETATQEVEGEKKTTEEIDKQNDALSEQLALIKLISSKKGAIFVNALTKNLGKKSITSQENIEKFLRDKGTIDKKGTINFEKLKSLDLNPIIDDINNLLSSTTKLTSLHDVLQNPDGSINKEYKFRYNKGELFPDEPDKILNKKIIEAQSEFGNSIVSAFTEDELKRSGIQVGEKISAKYIHEISNTIVAEMNEAPKLAKANEGAEVNLPYFKEKDVKKFSEEEIKNKIIGIRKDITELFETADFDKNSPEFDIENVKQYLTYLAQIITLEQALEKKDKKATALFNDNTQYLTGTKGKTSSGKYISNGAEGLIEKYNTTAKAYNLQETNVVDSAEYMALQAKTIQLSNDNKTLLEENKKLQHQLEVKIKANERVSKNNSNKNTEVNRSIEKAEKLQVELENLTAKISEQQTEIESLKAELQNRPSSNAVENGVSREDFTDLQQQYDYFESKYYEVKEKADKHEKSAIFWMTEFNKLDKKSKTFDEQIATVQKNVEEKDNELAQANTEKEALQNKLSEAEDNLKIARQEAEEAKNALSEAKNNVTATQTNTAQSTQEVANNYQEITDNANEATKAVENEAKAEETSTKKRKGRPKKSNSSSDTEREEKKTIDGYQVNYIGTGSPDDINEYTENVQNALDKYIDMLMDEDKKLIKANVINTQGGIGGSLIYEEGNKTFTQSFSLLDRESAEEGLKSGEEFGKNFTKGLITNIDDANYVIKTTSEKLSIDYKNNNQSIVDKNIRFASQQQIDLDKLYADATGVRGSKNGENLKAIQKEQEDIQKIIDKYRQSENALTVEEETKLKERISGFKSFVKNILQTENVALSNLAKKSATSESVIKREKADVFLAKYNSNPEYAKNEKLSGKDGYIANIQNLVTLLETGDTNTKEYTENIYKLNDALKEAESIVNKIDAKARLTKKEVGNIESRADSETNLKVNKNELATLTDKIAKSRDLATDEKVYELYGKTSKFLSLTEEDFKDKTDEELESLNKEAVRLIKEIKSGISRVKSEVETDKAKDSQPKFNKLKNRFPDEAPQFPQGTTASNINFNDVSSVAKMFVRAYSEIDTTLDNIGVKNTVWYNTLKNSDVVVEELVQDLNKILNSETSISEKEALINGSRKKADINTRIKNVFDTLSYSSQEMNGYLDTEVLSARYDKLYNRMSKFRAQNSKAFLDPNISKQFNSIFNQIASKTKMSEEQLKSFIAQFEGMIKVVNQSGNTGKTVLDNFKTLFDRLFVRNIANFGAYGIVQYFRRIYENVKAVNSAMTDLRKVSNETEQTYTHFLRNVGTEASNLGATMTSLIESTSDFARLGFNVPDASALAKNAVMYSNVGDIDVQTATEDVVSTLKAFDIQVADTTKIIDAFNEVGNNFALSSADIGVALKASSSAMAAAGNSMDETIAMVTGITEITQDADSAGGALKILSMRLRGAKVELEDAGEDVEGLVTSTSKLQEKILALTKVNGGKGFDIMSDPDNFKSTYEIMKGIASIWKDMSDANQASLLETIAGKNRSNQVAALLNNWGQVEKALNTSMNSAGSAAKENEAYIDSIEGRLAQLQATFEQISTTLLSSDLVKTIIQMGDVLLSGADSWLKWFDGLNTLPAIVTTATAALSLFGQQAGLVSSTLIHTFDDIKGGIEGNGNKIKAFWELMFPSKKDIANARKGIENYFSVLAESPDDTFRANRALESLDDTTRQFVVDAKSADVALKNYDDAMQHATTASDALVASIANIGINLAISASIALVSAGINYFIKNVVEAVDRAKEAVNELADECNSVKSQIDNLNTSLEENKQLVQDINDNPLNYTNQSEMLSDISEQNSKLSEQKEILEAIYEAKTRELKNSAKEYLNTDDFGYSWRLGGGTMLGDTWFGKAKKDTSVAYENTTKNDSLLQNATDIFGRIDYQMANIKSAYKELSSIDLSKAIDEKSGVRTGDYYKTLSEDVSRINQNLTENIEELQAQQVYFSPDEVEYQKIQEYIDAWMELNKQAETYANTYAQTFLNTNIDNDTQFIDDISKVTSKIASQSGKSVNANKFYEDLVSGVYENASDGLGKQFSKSFSITSQYIGNKNFATSTDHSMKYDDIISSLLQIQQLKAENEYIDSETNDALYQQLLNLAGLSETEADLLYKSKQYSGYKFLDNYLDVNDIDISNIAIDKYNTYKNAFIKAATSDKNVDLDESIAGNLFDSIFPQYDNNEKKFEAYVSGLSKNLYDSLIKKSVNGTLTPETLSSNQQFVDILENMGITANEAVQYIDKLKDSIIKEKAAASKNKADELATDFSLDKKSYDETYKENYEKYNTAIKSIEAGNSLTSEEMWGLISADKSLAEEFTRTATGYTISIEKLKESRKTYQAESISTFKSDIENSKNALTVAKDGLKQAKEDYATALSKQGTGTDAVERKAIVDAIADAKSGVKTYTEAIETNTNTLAQAEIAYKEALNPLTTYTDAIESATNKLSNFKTLYESLLNDISKTDTLSPDSIMKLMGFTDNWMDILKLGDDGKFSYNKDALIGEAEKQLGISDKTAEAQDQLKEYQNNLATTKNSLQALAEKYGFADQMTGNFTEDLTLLRTLLQSSGQYTDKVGQSLDTLGQDFSESTQGAEEATTVISILTQVFKDFFEVFEGNEALADFNDAVKNLDLKKSLGQISEKDYANEYNKLVTELNAGTTGTTDPTIVDAVNSAKGTNYSQLQSVALNDYEQKVKNIEQAYEDANNSAKEFYNVNKIDKFNKEMQKTYGLGNVDLTNRPKVDAETMRKSGYEATDGDTATVYTGNEIVWEGNEKDGEYVVVHYTPILPDGTVLSDKAMCDYVQNQLSSAEDILNADSKGLVLKVDSGLDITEEDYASLQSGNLTKHIQEVLDASDEWDNSLHEVQADWANLTDIVDDNIQSIKSSRSVYKNLVDLNEEYYGTNGKINDINGTTYEDNLRELTLKRSEYYNNETEQYKALYEAGSLTFVSLKSNIAEAHDFWLKDIKEISGEAQKTSKEITTYLYEQEVSLLDKEKEKGTVSTTTYARDLIKLWEEYYKDKDGFRQEDYEAEQAINEATRNAVQTQIDGINSLMEENSEYYQTQIDALEKVNDDISTGYDAQIKAIEEKISAIEDTTSAEDKHLAVLEAEDALEKARNQRNVARLNANGTITYVADQTEITSKEKDLRDAKKEYEVDKLEKEKEALEKEKEALTDANEKKIKDLNTNLKAINDPLSTLVKILQASVEENTQLDENFINQIIENNPDALKQLEEINRARNAAGLKEYTVEELKEESKKATENANSKSTTDEQNKALRTNLLDSIFPPKVWERIQTPLDNTWQWQKYDTLYSTPITTDISPEVLNAQNSNKAVRNAQGTGDTTVSINIDNLNINQPIGDAEDLVNALETELPNIVTQRIHKKNK